MTDAILHDQELAGGHYPVTTQRSLSAIDLHIGDCRTVLRSLPAESVHTVVTSPPYWSLRDYGVNGQYGLETTPLRYLARMRSVFREIRRVMRPDATLWLNMGDSHYTPRVPTGVGHNSTIHGQGSQQSTQDARRAMRSRRQQSHQGSLTGGLPSRRRAAGAAGMMGLKPKDMVGMPWLLALTLRADGWYLRSDIIWCLSGGAWVYARTAKGDMPVMVKDLVRLDPRTVKLWNGEKWTQALGWGPSTDTGERLELVLRSGERIGCTGGHLWPTQRGNVPARSLRVGDTIRSCVIPEPADAARPGHLTDDASWLAGLYLAEGSRSRSSARVLSLNANESGWLPRIEAVASHYGGTCTHVLDGESLTVRLYGHVLHAVIDAYVGGRVAADKHLTNAAWRLPNADLRRLIQGYLDGDAHHDHLNGRWRIGFCRNYALERDLRTAAARLGATLTLHPAQAAYQSGKRPSFRGEWRWNRSGHHNEKDRGEIVEIRSSRARRFWDIAVADEPHLFALASGVLTHNCKPNPMPESVRDRPTKSHEYLFMLAKSERYYFDLAAFTEPVSGNAHPRGQGVNPKARRPKVAGWADGAGKHEAVHHARAGHASPTKFARARQNESYSAAVTEIVTRRNRRTVWTIPPEPLKEEHYAAYPTALVEPCILAGCPVGGVVLDPFGGSGTTAIVAARHHRNAVLIELSPTYAKMAAERMRRELGLLHTLTVHP